MLLDKVNDFDRSRSHNERLLSWLNPTINTQFDADTYVLARAAEVLAQCYTPEVAPPTIIYLFCSSSPALQAVQNTRSIKAHSYALRFHKVLTTFFNTHDGTRIVLCWAPKDDSLEGNWLARSLAIRACGKDLADLPDGMDHIQSTAYQKDHARRWAFHQWELDYQLARVRNHLHVNATGLPLDRAAYQYVISQPCHDPCSYDSDARFFSLYSHTYHPLTQYDVP
jgi:hypothetical protein